MKKPRIAYLTDHYPRFSTTFIDREVKALRQSGYEVITFSRRAARPKDYGPQHTKIAQETVVLGSARSRLITLLRNSIRRPVSFFLLLRHALQISCEQNLKTRLRFLLYALEGSTLEQAMRKNQITCLHIHIANSSALLGYFAHHINSSISLSITMHGPQDFIDMANNFMKLKLSKADWVRVVTEYGRSQLRNFMPNLDPKIYLIRSGIDTTQFPMIERGPLQEKLRLIFVGRLSTEKNPFLAIEFFTLLKRRGRNMFLQVIGDGPLRENCEKTAKALGLDIGKDVIFSGTQSEDQVREAFARSDLLILTSDAEGLPTVIMEAMATGTMVLAANVMGVPELVEEGVTGHLAEAGSIESFVRAFEKWDKLSAEQRQTIRLNARKRVESHFDLAKSSHQLKESFNSGKNG